MNTLLMILIMVVIFVIVLILFSLFKSKEEEQTFLRSFHSPKYLIVITAFSETYIFISDEKENIYQKIAVFETAISHKDALLKEFPFNSYKLMREIDSTHSHWKRI